MKRLLLFILGGLVSTLGFSNPVSLEYAQSVATNFYTLLMPPGTNDTINNYFAYEYDESVVLYAFNFSAGGWVLVAADDISVPILGYSTSSYLLNDTLNEELNSLFDHYGERITYDIDNNIVDVNTTKKWLDIQQSSIANFDTPVEPLLASICRWAVWGPYFTGAPNNDGTNGCVPLAMSQIFKYWNYPLRPSGSANYYSSSCGNNLSINFNLEPDYNYYLMPYSLQNCEPVDGNWNILYSETSPEAIEVGRIQYHSGLAVNTGFCGSGTPGVDFHNYENAFENNFGFAHEAEVVYSTNSSLPDILFKEKLRNELNENRPIFFIYSGHAFVIDGYQDDGFGNYDYFHFVLGRAGADDAFYYLYDSDNDGVHPVSPHHTQYCSIMPLIPNPCEYFAAPMQDYIINSNENVVWEVGDNKYGVNSIILEPNSSLTIKCDVSFIENGSIQVQPGAKLVLDGSTLTNTCGGFWKGIKVLGNRNQNQYPIAQPVFQGMVYLSGASIEYANNAISAGQWDDWNASGGVIIAYNSSFTNNRRSIEYYSYDNKIGSNVLPNRGYFYNCIFDVNDEMDTQNGLSPFKWHVTAWGVEGVQFIGCKFKNSRTDNVWSDGNTNRAIYALSANLKVTGTCSNPDSQGKIESESPDFSGFQEAIELTGCNEVYSSFIQKCSFDKNQFGVKVNAMPKVSITRNQFSLGNNEISGTPSYVHGCVGVEVEECTGFEVEENFFDKTGSDLPTIGISTLNINLTEQINENNEIYRNRLDNMDYGIQATGVNRESDQFTGVQFLCNKFYTGVSYDIDITPNLNSSSQIDAIRIFQGSYDGTVNSRKAAGNLFSSTNDLDFFQINNECNSTINYQYNNSLNNLEYPTKISENVLAIGAYTTPIPINVAVNTCPSHISNGIKYPYTLQKKESLLAEFNSEKTAYWNLYYNYLQLIDGGSTPNVLFEIQSTWPQEAWDLRSDLLALSPFLSQEVLLEAANSGILPDAILLEIILANPDDSRGEDFLEELRSNIPNPLPEYMIEMIRNSWRTETSRTLIELGLAEHGAAKDFTFNRLMTELIYVSDSISKNYSDIRTLLSSRNELCDRYAIVDSYVAEGDFSSANSELYDIEQDYPFSERESDEHENYTNFVALLEGLYNNSKTIFEFDSTELASLESIANSETGLSSSKARNILCFAYDLCEYNYANPSTSGTPKNSTINTAKPNEFINNLYNKVFVSPNPAHDFAEFSWDLQLLESEAMLEIYDMSGKMIYQFQITEKIGSKVWPLSIIDSGNYNYRVKENDKILASGKMTII